MLSLNRLVSLTLNIQNSSTNQSLGGFLYYLQHQREKLLFLGAQWIKLLDGTNFPVSFDAWGPSCGDFLEAIRRHGGESVYGEETDSSISLSDSTGSSSGSDLDEDIILGMEGMDMDDSGNSSLASDDGEGGESGSDGHPPFKRKRLH